MARVPAGFQPEPGESRCGASWPRSITVTGEIPGTGGYGRDRKHALPRVGTLPGQTSYDTADERRFIEQVSASAERVGNEYRDASQARDITPEEGELIRYLLQLATSNLARAQNLYAYWRGDGAHPQTGERLQSEWPLPAGDDIDRYIAECAGRRGEWVEDRELVGAEVQVIRSYYCPGSAQYLQRQKDRNSIRRLLEDAAAAVRCAHFGLWRMVLYNAAYAQWSAQQTGMGITARPGEFVPPLGVQQRPGEYVPPLGFAAPPELPRILDPDEPEPDDVFPEEPGLYGETPPLPPPPPPRRPAWVGPVAVGGLAALAYYVLK